MDPDRAAAALGIAACAAVLAIALAPYLIADVPAVGTYYGVGPVGPPLVALFAVIVAIVLAAGVRRRTDPTLAAGFAVAVGVVMAVVAWGWALAVPASLVGGFTPIDTFEYHRWALAVAALVVPIAGGAYARAMLE